MIQCLIKQIVNIHMYIHSQDSMDLEAILSIMIMWSEIKLTIFLETNPIC